jgi:hypothetical protein
MKRALLSGLVAACVMSGGTLWATEKLNLDEVMSHVQAPGNIAQVCGGVFPQSLRISRDGQWLTAVFMTKDLHNTEVFMIKTDGSEKRLVPSPYGWKLDTLLLGGAYDDGFASTHPLRLLVSLHDALYARDLAGTTEWSVWQNGTTLGLTTDADARMLAMVHADLGQPGPAHYQKHGQDELWVQPIREGVASGQAYRVAANSEGMIRGPTFSADGKTLYFTLMKEADQAGPKVMLYAVENRPDAEAIDLIEGAIGANAAIFGSLPKGGKGDIVAFTRLLSRPGEPVHTPTGNIYARNLTSGVTDILVACSEPIVCSSPIFDPHDHKLYFVAQHGGRAGGIFVTDY